MATPSHWHVSQSASQNELAEVKNQLKDFQIDADPNLPPFVGGVAGLISYDWCRALERIELPRRDDFQTPTLAMGIYNLVLAWDHANQETWVIATGFPHRELPQRQQAAHEDLRRAALLIEQVVESGGPVERGELASPSSRQHYHSLAIDSTRYFPLARELSGTDEPILTATPMEDYYRSIQIAIDYLRAGDIFQVNLAQQLITRLPDSALNFYQRLRNENPAPMMGYLDTGNHQIISASPERLFSVRDRIVEARPIKGTAPRTGDPERDRKAGSQLLGSSKDCAENVMIVDLLRNDLSLVCDDSTVQVTALCELEPYQHVQHLTSVIQGKLRSDLDAWDVLPALFPGGSISGAPKVRAMQIINELEPVARGAYCGSLGYLSFADQSGSSNADWNILIRTATISGSWCQIPVGGGITLGSDPESEFDETLTKARGMLLALGASSRDLVAREHASSAASSWVGSWKKQEQDG